MQSFDQKMYGASELRIFGEKGAFFIRDYGFTVVKVARKASIFKGVRQLDYGGAKTTMRAQSAVSGALEHVIECHEQKKEPESSAASAAEIVRILDLISRSSKAASEIQ
jgi:predicted dehydrogenase